jgi:hypothetical protein
MAFSIITLSITFFAECYNLFYNAKYIMLSVVVTMSNAIVHDYTQHYIFMLNATI